MAKSKSALSQNQLAFVLEYLKSGNATEAAVKAGYSENGASVQGTRLLANVKIAAEIAKFQTKAVAKTEITLEKILSEYAAIAFGNMADLFDWDIASAQFIPKGNLTREQMTFIDSITVEERYEEVPNENHGNEKDDGTVDRRATIWRPVKKFKVGTLGREKVKALDSLTKLLGFDRKDGLNDGVAKEITEALAELDSEDSSTS